MRERPLNKPLNSSWLGVFLPVDVRPDIDVEDFIPKCPLDSCCPSYDGKRCDLTGSQPDAICIPAVSAMIEVFRAKAKT